MTGDGLRTTESSALGGRVRIVVDDAAAGMLPGAEAIVHQLHSDLTRFDPRSELSQLNADPRTEVEASPLMMRFLGDVIDAARVSGGLVDATCLGSVESAGYRETIDFSHQTEPPPVTRSLLPRHPAAPDSRARWAGIELDPERGLVRRPAGVRFDSGGLGKGLAADLVAEALVDSSWFSIDCGGDLRIGGTREQDAIVSVAGPIRGDGPVAEVTVPAGYAVATSGITRRAWTGKQGQYSHHLIDPGTGLPAFTGVIQATAVAPTAVEAEVRAKSALLTGPVAGAEWLEYGGTLILEAGGVIEVPAFLGATKERG